MEELENRMVIEEPKKKTWSELEAYEEHLLELQDQMWEDNLDE